MDDLTRRIVAATSVIHIYGGAPPAGDVHISNYKLPITHYK